MAMPFGSVAPILALPPMRSCTSSLINSYGYDAETKQLFVRFVHGMKLYRYDGFPAYLFNSMTEAVSPGKFFTQRVRNLYTGNYILEP